MTLGALLYIYIFLCDRKVSAKRVLSTFFNDYYHKSIPKYRVRHK